MTTNKNQFDLTILNKEVKNGGLFFGAKTVIKEIKKGNVSKVYLSNDIFPSILKDIEKEAKTHNLNIIVTDLDKEHMKEACKKPFNISVLGIEKGSEASRNAESEDKEESRKEIRAKKDLIQKEKKKLEDQEEKIEERKKRTEKETEDKKEKSEKKSKEKADKPQNSENFVSRKSSDFQGKEEKK